MKILKPKMEKNLNEIGQQFDGKFSFAIKVGEDIQRLHEYVKCRDFLGDIVWYNRYLIPTYIYGFHANKDRIIDKTKTCLLFKGNPDTINTLLTGVKTILNPIEKANKLKLTKVTPLLCSPEECLIEGDKFWQSTIWLISFYTFLIKIAARHWEQDWMVAITKTWSNERGYFDVVKGYFDSFSSNLKKIKGRKKLVLGTKDEATLDIHNVHNSGGFVSVNRLAQWKKGDNVYAMKIKELCL